LLFQIWLNNKYKYLVVIIILLIIIFLDKGEVFGWGNSEYGQLLLNSDKYQINFPKKLPLKSIGKIIDIGASGSACIALNGKIIKLIIFSLSRDNSIINFLYV